MAARTRESNRFDAVINGVNYRLVRDEDAYRKVSGRSQLEIQQMLNQAGNQFTSRRDLRPLFQTDWSGGAQWQKPLLSDQSVDTYYTSEGFDLTSEPGNIIPTPDQLRDITTWDNRGTWGILQVASDEVYFPVSGNNGSNDEIDLWNGTTASTLTNRWTTGTGTVWYGFCWDAENSTIFGLNGSNVDYVTPDTASGTVISVAGGQSSGANIFMHFGRLLIWTGTELKEVEDPLGTPALTTIYDDQMGPDALNEATLTNGSNSLLDYWQARLALASSEGVWIVKNVYQDGSIVPFITRVDRSNDGTNVGVPIATLPPGTVALGATYYLGSLIIATATDLNAVFDNDKSGGYPEIVFYHLTNDSLGTIGSPAGGLSPADSPIVFLGASDGLLFIGGHESVWAYDPIRGGFHQEYDMSAFAGWASSMAVTTDASGDAIRLYTRGTDEGNVRYLKDEGGNTDTHALESNYIDGNLPSELKSLVGITLMTSGIKTNETWTVSIEADDASSFTTAAAFDTVGDKTVYAALASAVTGYRFRYKIAYSCTSDVSAPSRVKGIVLHMVQGEMVTAWQLQIDGSEVRSVENQKLDPDDAIAGLETLMDTQELTTFVDEFKKTSTTHDVRVDSVQVAKDDPNELVATVVLTEQDLDN